MVLPKEDRGRFLLKGYPGLSIMGKAMSTYFPSTIKIYCEPFAGKARTAKYANAEKFVLNDMSDVSVAYLRKKFPHAEVTQEDFVDCIKRWDSKDTFFVLDPPWRYNVYTNNAGPVCNLRPWQYYCTLVKLCKEFIQGRWILCCDRTEKEIRSHVSRSGFPNIIIEHPTRVLYGHSVSIRLCSNMWRDDADSEAVVRTREMKLKKEMAKSMRRPSRPSTLAPDQSNMPIKCNAITDLGCCLQYEIIPHNTNPSSPALPQSAAAAIHDLNNAAQDQHSKDVACNDANDSMACGHVPYVFYQTLQTELFPHN